LPVKVCNRIADLAEYWPSTTVLRSELYQADGAYEPEVDNQEADFCYLVSDPVPREALRVRKIEFIIEGHDQGWSDQKSMSVPLIFSQIG
jgi:hypothetical protein